MDAEEMQHFVDEQKAVSLAIKYAIIAHDPMRLPMLFPLSMPRTVDVMAPASNSAAVMAMDLDRPVEIVSDDSIDFNEALEVLKFARSGTLDLSALEAWTDG